MEITPYHPPGSQDFEVATSIHLFYTLLLGWITDFHIYIKQKAELYSSCTY
jgi:hypothetical protein